MNLKTLFAIPITIILLVTLSVAAMVTNQGWSGLARGNSAIEAVERLRLLAALQTELRTERIISNFALGQSYPLPVPVKLQLDAARRKTDGQAAALDAWRRAGDAEIGDPPWFATLIAKLGTARALVDGSIARGLDGRTFATLATMMPRMLEVSASINDTLSRAGLAVTVADPGLSGLVTEDRLSASLRDQVGLIAAVLLPRSNKMQQPSEPELEKVRILLAQAAYLTQLLDDTIAAAGGTGRIRMSMAELRPIDVNGILGKMHDLAHPAETPQVLLVPWGQRIDVLRHAITDSMVERVTASQTARERQFDFVMTAFGLVMIGILESVVVLIQRVVGPLAHLGLAITRIAAGDRSVPLNLHSGTREISEMVTAVETLRQAALVADAAAMRQRVAARQRMLVLREALGIALTVRQPALELERGVARLSEGIDATTAFVTSATTVPPRTLSVAAEAVRVGLAEMRNSAADLDATFTAAGAAQTEDRPEAEFVAHILAVRAQVDRRDRAVRGFVHPSLIALRDTASATGHPPEPVLRGLVSDQFERIEETVAVAAAMLAAATRAAAIVRDMPLENTPIAA